MLQFRPTMILGSLPRVTRRSLRFGRRGTLWVAWADIGPPLSGLLWPSLATKFETSKDLECENTMGCGRWSELDSPCICPLSDLRPREAASTEVSNAVMSTRRNYQASGSKEQSQTPESWAVCSAREVPKPQHSTFLGVPAA